MSCYRAVDAAKGELRKEVVVSARLVLRIVPAIAISLLVSSMPLQSTAEGSSRNSAFLFEPLVKRGDPVTETGGFFFNCSDCEGFLAGFQALNNLNYAVVSGDSTGTCSTARYLVYQRSGTPIVDACHASAFGQFDSFGETAINDHLQVVFNATIPIGGRSVPGVFLYSDGNINKIATSGDSSPIGPISLVNGRTINSQGEIALTILTGDYTSSERRTGVFVYSAGELRRVVATGDPSPIGGVFRDVGALRIHQDGQVLFWADVSLPNSPYFKRGLFAATKTAITKVVVNEDSMPGVDSVVDSSLYPTGDLNFAGDVAFIATLRGGRVDSGVFERSGGQTSKIVASGDRSPVGGNFASFTPVSEWQPLPAVHVNSFGAVAFSARIHDGSTDSGIFLANSRAILKVVAIVDVVSDGKTLAGFRSPGAVLAAPSFAINDQGNLAFSAYDKKGSLIGVLLATPVTPEIGSVKLKGKHGVLELRVNGTGFITNDSQIQINGINVGELSYPDEFQENGGTTTRIVSRDSRLSELLVPGQPVEIKIANPLTAKLSVSSQFTRK
jgi:hypothetical protein